LPDVHYGHAEHFVDDAADTGISKWFLTGTDLDGNSLAARFEMLWGAAARKLHPSSLM
jgi:hypothetical protein